MYNLRLRKDIKDYFWAKMPERIKRDINILSANLWGYGGDFSDERINRVKDWIYSKSVYSDGDELYSRYAKGRERIDASNFKELILGVLARYI